jgi:hypothetical protein
MFNWGIALRGVLSGTSAAAVALVLGACGGGGEGAPATTTAATTATTTPAVPVNRAPVVANANADQRGAVGAAFGYNANQAGAVFTDPDGDSMTYTLTLSPAGGGLTVAGVTISGNPTTVGVVVATLTASDGKGGVTASPFSIVVGPSAG